MCIRDSDTGRRSSLTVTAAEVLGGETNQGVVNRSRGPDLTPPERPQQRSKLLANTAGWQRDLVFDGARVAVGHSSTDKALTQQSEHARIVGRDQRGEVTNVLLAGTISQPDQQLGTKPSALPFVDDGDRNFGSHWVFDEPDVASDAKAATVNWIQCDERFVVVVVDLGEVTQFRRGQVRLAHQESHCLLYTSPSPRDGLLSRMP